MASRKPDGLMFLDRRLPVQVLIAEPFVGQLGHNYSTHVDTPVGSTLQTMERSTSVRVGARVRSRKGKTPTWLPESRAGVFCFSLVGLPSTRPGHQLSWTFLQQLKRTPGYRQQTAPEQGVFLNEHTAATSVSAVACVGGR
ncbi:MAG: hypothetical protein QOF79_673 [Actinomycetota bacterium]|nr:hypothetical protein [Actinomycetota bacterium]